MKHESPLKVKTVEDMDFEQYKAAETGDLNNSNKKYGVVKHSKFSQGNSMVFDSDEEGKDKENLVSNNPQSSNNNIVGSMNFQ